MHQLVKIQIAFVLLTWSTFVFSATGHLPKNNPVPGGVIHVHLGMNTPNKPLVYFNKTQVAVIKDTNGQKTPWVAVVGIPLETKPGKHQLDITAPINKHISFVVRKKHYASHRLTIKNQSKISPSISDTRRIKKEKTTIDKTLSHYSDNNPFQIKFAPPIKGRISSSFGLHRLYNKKLRGRHTGMDIAAPAGTEIKTTAPGIVLTTGDFFYTGNTVFIDHGRSLITLYAHLGEILVKPGQHVNKSTVIGTVGTTGRATGAHLHWGVILNKTRVEPLLFVNKKEFHKPTPARRQASG